MSPAETLASLILGLGASSLLGWTAFIITIRRLFSKADLLVSLKASLTYEAIALYDADQAKPSFVFVADRFAEIMAQLRNPHVGERHWDYWSHFRDSRGDWSSIIDRVLHSHRPESREGEVILNADGSMVVIDWEIGPRFDSGRLWRRPRVCGFYITHRRSFTEPNYDVIGPHYQAMIDANARLKAENERLSTEAPQVAAAAAIQRLVTRHAVPAEVKEVLPKSLTAPDPLTTATPAPLTYRSQDPLAL